MQAGEHADPKSHTHYAVDVGALSAVASGDHPFARRRRRIERFLREDKVPYFSFSFQLMAEPLFAAYLRQSFGK